MFRDTKGLDPATKAKRQRLMEGDQVRDKPRVPSATTAAKICRLGDGEGTFLPTAGTKGVLAQMQLDQNSRCRPDKDPPTGVEGGRSPFQIHASPHSVPMELRKLEALARDRLQAANAALITFAHLINGLFQPDKALSEEAKQRTLFL